MPSKSVGGRKLAGGFDSRPPPLPKARSDQRRCAEPGERRSREGPDRGPTDRVHHTSLSVFLCAAPDKSSDRPPEGRTVFGRRPLEERRKRHGPPRWTTDGEEVHLTGGPARGIPGALGVPEPQRQDPSGDTTTAPDGSPTGAQPRGSCPRRTFAGPTSSGSSCTAVIRASRPTCARVRAGPEDLCRLGHRVGWRFRPETTSSWHCSVSAPRGCPKKVARGHGPRSRRAARRGLPGGRVRAGAGRIGTSPAARPSRSARFRCSRTASFALVCPRRPA